MGDAIPFGAAANAGRDGSALNFPENQPIQAGPSTIFVICALEISAMILSLPTCGVERARLGWPTSIIVMVWPIGETSGSFGMIVAIFGLRLSDA
jgi:hypothetical protein